MESNNQLGNKNPQPSNLEFPSCLLSTQDLQAPSDHGSGAAGQRV